MSKIDRVGIGFSVSPDAYVNADGVPVATMPTPILAHHRFYRTDEGAMAHDIDGRLRAIVPPEGLEDYVRCWPAAAELAAALAGKPIVAGAIKPARRK